MITGKTESGFEFELNEEALDDYEMLEDLRSFDKGEYGVIIDVVDKLLGEEQKDRLKDHIRNKEGKVSAQKMMEEITCIFEVSKELKN